MEVDIEHVADVVQYIVQRLRKSKKEIKELQFDSKNVLFSDDPKDSSTKMLQVNLDINMLHGLGIDHINERTPDDHFTDLRIYGQIGSEEQRGKRESFEIQIVPVGNTNELGLSHHTIWEKLGSFKALIRLFGRVPASWVEEFINDAYAASTTDDQVTEFVLSASKKDSLKKVSAPEGNQHRINYERLKKEAIRRRFLNHTVRLVDGKITTVKEINRLGELGTLPNGMETAYAILQHPTEPTKAIIRSDVEQVIKGKGPNPFKDIPPCSIFIIGEDGGVTVEHHH